MKQKEKCFRLLMNKRMKKQKEHPKIVAECPQVRNLKLKMMKAHSLAHQIHQTKILRTRRMKKKEII
jgi:hypothetical protein